MLGRVAEHLLLMTATPHSGKEDFQLFLRLLDTDRFGGRYRKGVHGADVRGVMLPCRQRRR